MSLGEKVGEKKQRCEGSDHTHFMLNRYSSVKYILHTCTGPGPHTAPASRATAHTHARSTALVRVPEWHSINKQISFVSEFKRYSTEYEPLSSYKKPIIFEK